MTDAEQDALLQVLRAAVRLRSALRYSSGSAGVAANDLWTAMEAVPLNTYLHSIEEVQP